MEEFRSIIVASEKHATKRRRITLKAMELPGMRTEAIEKEVIFSQSDLLRATLEPKVDLAAELYPTANSKPAEDKEQKRHLLAVRIGQIIADCGLPAAKLMMSSVAPERYLGRFGAGRLLSTLRNKVRVFVKMQKWMWATYNKPILTEMVEILEHILDR